MSKEGCLLWEEARRIGESRGLRMSQKCPMEAVCTGERCVYLDPVRQASQQVEKFYGKLEKHNELRKKLP